MLTEAAIPPVVPNVSKLELSFKRAEKDLGQEAELSDLARGFADLASDVGKPPLVLVMGAFNAGKSTFLNALLGKELLVMNALPATAAVTVLTYGEKISLRAWNRDGSNEPHDIQDLVAISAEGNPIGQEIRSKLKYLELSLPEKVLKRVTLVDTPGLNADNDLHTAATNEFQSRADAIIWLVAHGAPVNKFELAYIKSLPKSVNLVAVVNQIDQHDDDEGPLEEIIEMTQSRLENIPRAVVAVSARDAMVALSKNDQDLLRRSRWYSFEKLFSERLLSDARPAKVIRVLERTCELVSILSTRLSEVADELSQAHRALHSRVDLKHDLKLQRRDLDKLLLICRRMPEPVWEHFRDGWDLPNSVPGFAKINNLRTMLLASYDEVMSEKKDVESRERHLAWKRQCLHGEFATHQDDKHKYEHSGVFGNEPWFRNSEWGERVKKRQEELDMRWRALVTEETQIQSERRSLDARVQRFANEIGEFYGDVISTLESRIAEIKTDLGNLDAAQEQAKTKITDCRWVYRSVDRIAKAKLWNISTLAKDAAAHLTSNGNAAIVLELLSDIQSKSTNLERISAELRTHRIPEERSLPAEREEPLLNSKVKSRSPDNRVLRIALAIALIIVGFVTWPFFSHRQSGRGPNQPVTASAPAPVVPAPAPGVPCLSGPWDANRALELVQKLGAQVRLDEAYTTGGEERRVLVILSDGGLERFVFVHKGDFWALEGPQLQILLDSSAATPIVELVKIGSESYGLKVTDQNRNLEILMLGPADQLEPVWTSSPCSVDRPCHLPDPRFIPGPVSQFYDLQVVAPNGEMSPSLFRINDQHERYVCVDGPCMTDPSSAPEADDGGTAYPVSSNQTISRDEQSERGVRTFLARWKTSFEQKDLITQVDCYASVLDTYFLRHNVPNDFVAQEKERAFRAIAEIRTFSISDVVISFNGQDRALVTFYKKWDTTLTSGKQYSGEETQFLDLHFVGGSWKITTEGEIKVISVNRN